MNNWIIPIIIVILDLIILTWIYWFNQKEEKEFEIRDKEIELMFLEKIRRVKEDEI